MLVRSFYRLQSTVDGQSVNTMDKLSKLAKKMGSETALGLREMT